MKSSDKIDWLDQLTWGSDGLIPVVAQDSQTNAVLMVAWMDRQALKLSAQTGEAHYWSRSRKKIWRKGEQSGHVQKIADILLDCDQDVILLRVQQIGGIACHTGRYNCFFRKLENGTWNEVQPILKDPKEIYKSE